jgi:hypothetical protein
VAGSCWLGSSRTPPFELFGNFLSANKSNREIPNRTGERRHKLSSNNVEKYGNYMPKSLRIIQPGKKNIRFQIAKSLGRVHQNSEIVLKFPRNTPNKGAFPGP